jgi:Protein of unknown function (DUF4012)
VGLWPAGRHKAAATLAVVTPREDPNGRPPRRRRRRVVFVAVLGFLALAGLLVMIEGLVLLDARSDLEAGRTAARNARSALTNGDPSQASADFDRAEARFEAAFDSTRTPLGRVAAWLPFAGNSVDVAAGLADAGVHVARAGHALSDAIAVLPNGLGSLAPSGGRLPLHTLGGLADAAGTARTEAEAAQEAVRATPTSFLPGSVLEARWDAEQEVDEVVNALTAGDLLLQGLPSFAGGDGVRRYLVLPQNPAELRGSGGFWGAHTVLTFHDGRPTFSSVEPTSTLPAVTADEIPPPSPDYRAIYDQFGGAASWDNMNMSPDFPSVARAALGNYAAATGAHLDGVIAADPFALEPMLTLTGPVPVPGVHRTIDAATVVRFTTNEAYRLFGNSTERKEALGAVATGVLERFFAIEGRGTARLRAIAKAAANGHLLVYTTDEAFEQGLDLAGAAGTFAPEGSGDVVAVTVNNATAAKIDFWSTRNVRYAVSLGGDHEAIADLDVTIHNDAPTEGLGYLIGPIVKGAEPGDQVLFLSASCHAPCTLVSSERNGEPIAFTAGSELGIPWFRDYTTIPSGQTGSWSLRWTTNGVWDGNSSGGTYRLTYLGQPTIRPTSLQLRIEAPPGTRVVWTSVPMTVDGGVATWEGTPQPRTVFEVRFRAPLPLRVLRNVTRPVFG